MPTKKKVVKKESEVTTIHLDEIWDVIDELQKNLNFINDKLDRVLNRLGL